jgi:ribonucleotide reductase alpha subunit
MSNGTKVKKRDGRIEPLDLDKMHLMVDEACQGLAGVSASQVEMKSGIQFYDGITTAEIQEILIRAASDLIDLDHPNYQFVAARLLLFSLRKSLYGKMRELPHLEAHIMDCTNIDVYDKDIFLKYSKEEIDKANGFIDHDRDFLFTYAGLRQVVDKYLVQDRSGGGVYETPQFMYIMIALTILQSILKRQTVICQKILRRNLQAQDSTFPHLSWRECELHFDNLLAVFLLMLMTPSILSLALIWQLANTLHKGRESVSTQAESVASTVKSEGEKFSTQALFRFSKSLNQLSDAALKMASEVDQLLSTFQSGTKKSKTSSSSRTTKEQKTTA